MGLYANRPDVWAGICRTIGMRHRGELTDQEWEALEPLLPPEKPERGRPNVDHRRIINGILWRERTGAPWRDLPERYGPWSTVYSRFWRWREAGVWDRIFAAVQQQADEAGEVDWSVHFVDGSVIRAHQHAAGARGGPSIRGVGAQPGRLLDQGAPQGRWGRPAADRAAHSWSAARVHRLRATHAPGSDPSARTRPAAHPSLPGLGR